MPLYHIYNLIDNTKPVFIVEGEKDVETMEKLGYIATTSPNGAGSEKKNYFAEKKVLHFALQYDIIKSGKEVIQNAI